MTLDEARGLVAARRMLGPDAEKTAALGATEEIIEALNDGIAAFWFLKADGTLRHALGTRNHDIISQWEERNGIEITDTDTRNDYKRRNASETAYFDLEANDKDGNPAPAWRSFVPERAVAVDESFC